MHKLCGPYVIALLIQMPICQWYMGRLVVKNGHYNDMCYNKIGLMYSKYRHGCGLNSEHNWEGLFGCLKGKIIFI